MNCTANGSEGSACLEGKVGGCLCFSGRKVGGGSVQMQ